MSDKLNPTPEIALSSQEIQRADLKAIENYRLLLNKLINKKRSGEELTLEDKNNISRAREFISIVESKNYAEGIIKRQTRELLRLLKDFEEDRNEIKLQSKKDRNELKSELLTDETKAIIKFLGLNLKDVNRINIYSALDLISKNKIGTDYESWEEFGYKKDGWIFDFFELRQLNALSSKIDKDKLAKYIRLKNEGISIKDVENTRIILENTNEDEVFKVIFDIDNSLMVDKNDNKSIIQFKNLFEIVKSMLLHGEEQQLLKSIGNSIGKEYNSKKELYDDLLKNPELKYKILKYITLSSGAGNSSSTFAVDNLKHGREATRVSLDKKAKIDKYLEGLFNEKQKELDEKYNTAISEFESKLSPEKKAEFSELLNRLKSSEVKNDIFDNFKLNGIGILASLVETRKGIGGLASFSNINLDQYLKEKTNKIVSGVNFDIGFVNLGGKIVPGIGASIDLSHDISPETQAFGKIGIINLIPYAILGIKTQINEEELKKSSFIDLSKEAKYIGASINISPISWGLTAHYNKDQLKGIEKKEKDFKDFLNNVLKESGEVDLVYIKSMPDYIENKSYYDTFEKNIQDFLRSQNFDSLSIDYKKRLLSSIKTSYTFIWRENMLKQAQDNGYKFSGVGIGIQFIAGFLPLPTFGIGFSRVNLHYSENHVSRLYAILNEYIETVEITTEEKRDGSEETKIDSISLEENIFEKNKDLFRNFAQRHPNDWKRLITGNNTFEQKVDLVINMLKTDRRNRNNPIFKLLVKEFTRLKKSTNIEDKKRLNDLMAQFFDISFRDLRDIEEVILGITIKDNKYEGNYDFISSRNKAVERFALELGISPDFSKNTMELYKEIAKDKEEALKRFKRGKATIQEIAIEQKKDPTLYGFVASYKIDADKKSLGRGIVEIPAGQVTVAGGKERKITDERDINFVVENFKKSIYGKNTINQILNQIRSKNEKDFLNISESDIETLLKTGKLERNGKIIELQRDFVYFLYGRCANESMGLRINKLTFTGFNISKTISFVRIREDGTLQIENVDANTTNIVSGSTKNVGFGVIGGREDDGRSGGGGPGGGGIGGGGTIGGGGNDYNPGAGGGGNIP